MQGHRGQEGCGASDQGPGRSWPGPGSGDWAALWAGKGGGLGHAEEGHMALF